jgi:hypothetical protein
MTNLSLKHIFNAVLISFLILFFTSIFIIDGYPHNNDILFIFKISSLEDDLKFINGLYGPGFTYYVLLLSDSLTLFTIIICLLTALSSFLISILLNKITLDVSYNQKITIYIFALIFHLIIILSAGFNPSENIFLILFYNGVISFIFGYYFAKNIYIYSLGILFLSISILFRQHGILALFIIYIYFVTYETFQLKKSFLLHYKKYFWIGFLSILPFIVSIIHLLLIDSFRMWQTSWRLHMIFFVDLWGDWRDIKYLIEEEKILEFNLSKISISKIWLSFKDFSIHALKILSPFIITFVVCYFISKKKLSLFALGLFLTFVLLVLPGYHKGYFPILLLSFITVLLTFKELSENKITASFVFILLFGHLFYLSERYLENFNYYYKINLDIKKNIIPYVNDNNLKFNNIFSDDLNFYNNKIDGKISEICNWGGWYMLHPNSKDYHPRQAIIGKKNRFCDVKLILTKDEKFVKEYIKKDNINLKFKSDYYYILTVN